MAGHHRDLLPYRRPQRAQGDEEAGAAVVAPKPVRPVPIAVEVREVLLGVVVEAPPGLSDRRLAVCR